MTYDERQIEINRIKADNRATLAVPLMSDGGISPAQVGMMSQNVRESWMRKCQERLTLESRIRELSQSDAEIAATEQFYTDKARNGRVAQLTRRIEDLSRVGIGKSGKMRPTYQRELDKAKAELSTIL